jgi:hypothetical protein
MGPDCLLGIVDPAMWPRLLDHGAEIALPRGGVRDLGPFAQRVLIDTGMTLVLLLGSAAERAPHLLEPRRAAFDHDLEGAEVVLVFERYAAVGGDFDEHQNTPKLDVA